MSADVRDQDRLRYVTQNFNRLQGLNTVVFGATLLAACGVIFCPWLWGAVVGTFVVTVAAWLMLYLIANYYDQRFGLVHQKQERTLSGRNLFQLAGFGFMIGFQILLRYLSVPAFVWDYAWPILFINVLFADKRRWIYVVPISLLAGLVCLELTPNFPRHGIPTIISWSLAFILIGICDHLMLLRLLPKRLPEDGNE